MSFCCSQCGFDLWNYISTISIDNQEACHVGLYSDSRYPGRCIVAFPSHKEHYEELEPEEAAHLMSCAARVGAVLRNIVGADRVNYAILGNAIPHVHVHVIPRFKTDPNLHSSPWSRADKASQLSSEKRTDLISRIKEYLNGF